MYLLVDFFGEVLGGLEMVGMGGNGGYGVSIDGLVLGVEIRYVICVVSRIINEIGGLGFRLLKG